MQSEGAGSVAYVRANAVYKYYDLNSAWHEDVA
jgi:hypothetical protein